MIIPESPEKRDSPRKLKKSLEKNPEDQADMEERSKRTLMNLKEEEEDKANLTSLDNDLDDPHLPHNQKMSKQGNLNQSSNRGGVLGNDTRTVKFSETNPIVHHQSLNNYDHHERELLEGEEMEGIHMPGGFTSKHQGKKRSAFEYKFADYMRPLNKGSSKGVTQFDQDMSEHLLHNERCGPNCVHLLRSSMRSPTKGNRRILPLKKQKIELDE